MDTKSFSRHTKETKVEATFGEPAPGGRPREGIATSWPFLDHMLAAMAFHGVLGLVVQATGDVANGYHHLAEDTGYTVGRAVAEVIGEGRGVRRFGEATVPMDEALTQVVLDLGGRPGTFLAPAEAVERLRAASEEGDALAEFFTGFARGAACTLHLRFLAGASPHHQWEAGFKAFGLALREALGARPSAAGAETAEVSSTKGLLRG